MAERFHKLPDVIARQPSTVLTSSAKVLYSVLLNMSKDGRGSFGQRLLCSETGLFNGAVIRAIARLEKYGLITCRRMKTRSAFVITPPEEWKMRDSTAPIIEADEVLPKSKHKCSQKRSTSAPKTEARKELIKNNNKEHGSVPPAQPAPVNLFKDWFSAEYQKQFGRPYIFSHAKDGAVIKRLLDSGLSQDDLRRATRAMFGDEDWGRDRAGIGLLSAQINKWLSAKAASAFDEDYDTKYAAYDYRRIA